MRAFLFISVTTAFALVAASGPSDHDGRSGRLRHNNAPSSATENYRGWDDDRRWSHRWDHYFGDDGEDEDDEDVRQGDDDDEAGDKWPRGHWSGGEAPWSHHRHGGEGEDDVGGRHYPSQERDEGKHGHGHGQHRGGEDRGRGNSGETRHVHDRKPSDGEHSPTERGDHDQHRHGHDSHRGSDGRLHDDQDRDDGGGHGRRHDEDSERDRDGGAGREHVHEKDAGRDRQHAQGRPSEHVHRDKSPVDGVHPWNNEGDDRGGNDRDDDDRDDDDGREQPAAPVKAARVAQLLRTDTEAFVTDTLEWVNEIIGEDAASTLVIDTTFSLTKNEFADLERGPCGSTYLASVFPVLQKFIESPKDVDVLDSAVQQIAWAPSSSCAPAGGSSEVEGGIYASVQVRCADSVVLNVSIASSGSTPTIQGQAVEDKSLYINVDISNGRVQAIDAQGSISGILENRHFPQNAGDIQKNWTSALGSCGAEKTLSVVGVVGGGWTTYARSENASNSYHASAVGFTESFAFSFAQADPASVVPNLVPAPSVGDTSPALPSEPNAGAIATSGASAYVKWGVMCHQSSDSPKACAGPAVMSQLTSFYAIGSKASTQSAAELDKAAAHTSTTTLLAAAAVLLAAAFVAVERATSRRRSGYSALEIPSTA